DALQSPALNCNGWLWDGGLPEAECRERVSSKELCRTFWRPRSDATVAADHWRPGRCFRKAPLSGPLFPFGWRWSRKSGRPTESVKSEPGLGSPFAIAHFRIVRDSI